MVESKQEAHTIESRRYLTKSELAARSGLSAATIQRLKDLKKIPFYQPAGKGGKILFPPDAIELATVARAIASATPEQFAQLSGPRPRWQND